MWTTRDEALASYLEDVYGISKAQSYGQRSSAGSLGHMSNEEYDQRVAQYKSARRKKIASTAAMSGALSGGLTYALNRATKSGIRGPKLRKTTAGMTALGAAIPVGIAAPASMVTNQRIRSPEGRRKVEAAYAQRKALARLAAQER